MGDLWEIYGYEASLALMNYELNETTLDATDTIL